MRIHVSGDFYCRAYSEVWKTICETFPQTKFWAYTRSWLVRDLVRPLEQLRALPNVELIGSTDPTMPLPPEGWRVAFIQTDPRANGTRCNQQHGVADSCLDCGYCFRQDNGNVVFRVH